jgi:hypothetical protein
MSSTAIRSRPPREPGGVASAHPASGTDHAVVPSAPPSTSFVARRTGHAPHGSRARWLLGGSPHRDPGRLKSARFQLAPPLSSKKDDTYWPVPQFIRRSNWQVRQTVETYKSSSENIHGCDCHNCVHPTLRSTRALSIRRNAGQDRVACWDSSDGRILTSQIRSRPDPDAGS